MRPLLARQLETCGSEYLFPSLEGKMLKRDNQLVDILRAALKRAGIIEGFNHICRRNGCGYRERRPDDKVTECPKCA